MTVSLKELVARVTADNQVEICAGHEIHHLAPAAAFCYAHSLFLEKNYPAAVEILNVLGQFTSYARRTNFLLAACLAAMGDDTGATKRLRAAVGRVAPLTTKGLHAAFVHESAGILPHAIHELHTAVHSGPPLPTPCLLLGDFLLALGQSDDAAQYWKLAIQRDIAGGSVALAAQRQLARLARKKGESHAHNGEVDARERPRCWIDFLTNLRIWKIAQRTGLVRA
jgi:hypothetical protein